VGDQLAPETANLRAALTWLDQTNQDEELLRLVEMLHHFWYYAGHLNEGRTWFERALALISDEPTPERALALYRVAHFAHYLNDDETAVHQIEEAEKTARQVDSLFAEAEASFMFGVILEDSGQYERAEEMFFASRELYARASSDFDIIIVTYHLGVVEYGRGDIERATAYFEETLAAGSVKGDTAVVPWCKTYLAQIAVEQGNLQRSSERLREVTALGLEGGLRHVRHHVISTVAVLGCACGETDTAVRLLGAAEAEFIASGERPSLPERAAWEQAAVRLRSALGDAAYERAFSEGKIKSPEAVMADIERVFAAASPPAVSSAEAYGLTARDFEVLRLLVDGRSNPDIAEILFISPRTATTHVTNILAKLGVASRTEAATRAVRDGLV
jgi:ATP/maltotriose-dependent transcriptional regulator MalT